MGRKRLELIPMARPTEAAKSKSVYCIEVKISLSFYVMFIGVEEVRFILSLFYLEHFQDCSSLLLVKPVNTRTSPPR